MAENSEADALQNSGENTPTQNAAMRAVLEASHAKDGKRDKRKKKVKNWRKKS